jgi:hypothetical protein
MRLWSGRATGWGVRPGCPGWPPGRRPVRAQRPGRRVGQSVGRGGQGERDFEKAKHDLLEYAKAGRSLKGTTIRLLEFERGPMLKEFTLE